MTQKEAIELLNLDKYFRDKCTIDFPPPGGRFEFDVFSDAPRKCFAINAHRRNIIISMCSFQTRTRSSSVVLARLDINGKPHRNPDGKVIEGTHLHLYNEVYRDKVAYPLPDVFTNVEDLYLTLDQFLDYCHVVVKPVFNRSLF